MNPSGVDWLTADEQAALLRVARQALEARVRGGAAPSPEGGGGLSLLCGAFVSVHRRGVLRACLGRLECDAPLVATIAHLGTIVADRDPRFADITEEELADIDIEISVLTPEREVQTIDEIEIGRHGLVVERGLRRGLLLPQVAVEHAWDREAFLTHTCIKAGLPPHAWREGARVLLFDAQVFGERRLTDSTVLP